MPLGLPVWGFRVYRFQGLGCRVRALGLGVQGLGLSVQGLAFGEAKWSERCAFRCSIYSSGVAILRPDAGLLFEELELNYYDKETPLLNMYISS